MAEWQKRGMEVVEIEDRMAEREEWEWQNGREGGEWQNGKLQKERD